MDCPACPIPVPGHRPQVCVAEATLVGTVTKGRNRGVDTVLDLEFSALQASVELPLYASAAQLEADMLGAGHS